MYFIFAWGGTHDGVGRVGLGPPIGVFPLSASAGSLEPRRHVHVQREIFENQQEMCMCMCMLCMHMHYGRMVWDVSADSPNQS